LNGRVYDPLLARFTSADTITESPFSTQGWNRYSYVGNDPLALHRSVRPLLPGLFLETGRPRDQQRVARGYQLRSQQSDRAGGGADCRDGRAELGAPRSRICRELTRSRRGRGSGWGGDRDWPV